MLLQRVLTAFVLLFVVFAAVFYLPLQLFSLFIALVISVSVWEWSALAGIKNTVGRVAYVIFMLGCLWVALHAPIPVEIYFIVGLVFWVAAYFFIYAYRGQQSGTEYTLLLMLVGLPLFVPGWMAFVWLREQQYFAFHVLSVFAVVAAADTGAYFAGRAYGRYKLAVNVSPNKTWEGFCGGMLASGLIFTVTTFLFVNRIAEISVTRWLLLVGCAMLIAAFSVVGDLFESMIKRYRDVKDSGAILPGHGGILDRIDGLTAAAPVYALLLVLLAPRFAA